jgi:multiple sugar transport system substrate-binding protein
VRRLRLALVWLLLAAACQAAPPPAVAVSFMVFGDPAEHAIYRQLVDQFHASQSAVRVELVALPSQEDFMLRLAADYAAGAPPDVFLLNYRRLAQFHNRQALEPLGPWLAESAALREDQFYPVALEAFRDGQGQLVCLPQNISSQVIFYNQDLFDAAGLPYPAPGWTWEDFRQTALRLTQPDLNADGEPDQYGLGLEPTLIRVAPFIWQNGGELVDDFARPTRLVLDTPEAQQAVAFVMALSLEDGVVPNQTAEVIASHGDRFLSGSVAMYVNSRRLVPVLREAAAFRWDVAPLPRGVQSANVLHSDGFCLAAPSPRKAAAWTFIEFAVGVEGQRLMAALGRTVPSLIEVALSDAYLESGQPPASAEVWLDALPGMRLLPRLENWSEIERTAFIELELAFLGRQPLDFALNSIQLAAQRAFVPLR